MKISLKVGRVLDRVAMKHMRQARVGKCPVFEAFRDEVALAWVESGMSKSEFSEHVGLGSHGSCGYAHLVNFLNGRRNMLFPTMVKIANVLGIDLGELQRRFK